MHQPLHSIYDTTKIDSLLSEKGKAAEPEFYDPPSCPFYSYDKGEYESLILKVHTIMMINVPQASHARAGTGARAPEGRPSVRGGRVLPPPTPHASTGGPSDDLFSLFEYLLWPLVWDAGQQSPYGDEILPLLRCVPS
jgi:hypothetical protein